MAVAGIAQAQKSPQIPRVCVQCYVVIALSERGVQKAARDGIVIGELHGDCLQPWKLTEAARQKSTLAQGGDNSSERHQPRFQFQRR